jgi:nucleoside-triphosphatase THEP1
MQDRTKWINCLAMLSKSLLKYTEPTVEAGSRKDVIVIDEFDQMEKQFKNFKFLRSFKVYLKEVLTKSCVGELSNMKFIFISNKSYQSISE